MNISEFDYKVSLRADLTLLGGNGGIAVDQPGEDTTEGLNAKREGSDV